MSDPKDGAFAHHRRSSTLLGLWGYHIGQKDERPLLAIQHLKYNNTIRRYNENPLLEEMHGSKMN